MIEPMLSSCALRRGALPTIPSRSRTPGTTSGPSRSPKLFTGRRYGKRRPMGPRYRGRTGFQW